MATISRVTIIIITIWNVFGFRICILQNLFEAKRCCSKHFGKRSKHLSLNFSEFIAWCIHCLMYSSPMHSSCSNVFVDIYLERSVVAQSILQSEASIYHLISMNSLHDIKCFLRKCNCFGLHRLRLSTFMTPISSWRYILMPFPFPNVSKSCHHCCSLETWVFD